MFFSWHVCGVFRVVGKVPSFFGCSGMFQRRQRRETLGTRLKISKLIVHDSITTVAAECSVMNNSFATNCVVSNK